MLVSIKENQTLPKHLKQGIGRVLITGVKNKDKIMEKKEFFKKIDKGLMSEETAQKLNIGFTNIKNDMENDMKGKQVKRLNIIPPEGYEMNVDKHGIVTFIKNKEKEPVIRTWGDLVKYNKVIPKGSYIVSSNDCRMYDVVNGAHFDDGKDRNFFIDEKHAKSALAMAMISQLMPYYGGAITDKEWNDDKIYKYVISRTGNEIVKNIYGHTYFFLAFHTAEQRDSFLKYNEQLVKDYLMIE